MDCKVCGAPIKLICAKCSADICRKHPCNCYTPEQAEKLYEQLDERDKSDWFQGLQSDKS
jgi:hypothetical protein